jgi:hypothetical protein
VLLVGLGLEETAEVEGALAALGAGVTSRDAASIEAACAPYGAEAVARSYLRTMGVAHEG